MLVDLQAEVAMTTNHSCIVSSIRRINSTESPLLPVLQLEKEADKWSHADTGKQSRICTAIGLAIERYLEQDHESGGKIRYL